MPSIYSPTQNDEFEFTPYVKALEAKIRSTALTDLPITIGIYGAWGSGKTSFMLQLRESLQSSSGEFRPLPTIWFDAWKYDRIEDVRSALIFKILRELEEKSEGRAKNKIRDTVQNATKVMLAIASRTTVSIGIPGATLKLPSAEDILKDWTQYHTFRTAIDTFAKNFADAVGAFLDQQAPGQSEAKLVVFIDDLDRCLPDNVVMVLEALKLFMDESRSVFVLGADRLAVESSVMLRYGPGLPSAGREYLDKIVNYPFTLPVPDRELVQQRFSTLAKDIGLDNPAMDVFAKASMANPRLFSRILSAWDIVTSMRDDLELDLHDDNQRLLLALATALRIRFPSLHELCRRRPDKFSVLLGMCFADKARGGRKLAEEGAAEYQQYWDDPAVQTYLGSICDKVQFLLNLGRDEAAGMVSAAFGLSLNPERADAEHITGDLDDAGI